MMVHILLSSWFKRQSLPWDGATVLMKEYIGMIWKIYLTSHEMREVAIQITELFSDRDATEGMVKILYSNYSKAYLE